MSGDRSTVAELLRSLTQHSPMTAQHCARVASYGARTARLLGLASPTVHVVRLAGLLHDVGKLAVPVPVLNKPGALSDGEWTIMRGHPAMSLAMLEPLPGLAPLLAAVAFHHERMDGRGYPYGLRGSDIPLEARIIAVCDAYDSITADRPYRRGVSPGEAADQLRQAAGAQFDPVVVRHFTDLVLPTLRLTHRTA